MRLNDSASLNKGINVKDSRPTSQNNSINTIENLDQEYILLGHAKSYLLLAHSRKNANDLRLYVYYLLRAQSIISAIDAMRTKHGATIKSVA